MQSVIRRMRESDLDEVLGIEKVSFLSPWSRCAFENEMRASYAFPMVLTQFSPSLLQGYLCFWLVLDECRILNLAVHPECRRQGIASEMIHNLMEMCSHKKICHCQLEVRVSNRIARSLYHKYGFKDQGVHKNYYNDTGEDALILKRRIHCQ